MCHFLWNIIISISMFLTDNLYNDLGIMAGNNRLLLLLEAQSSWTVNILVRILLYLAQSYHEYFERTSQSLYKGKKVKMPKPELLESDIKEIESEVMQLA